MHSLSFLNSERKGKLRAVFTAGLTTVKEENEGVHTIFEQISWVLATCRVKSPSPQNFSSITSRLDKADSVIPDFLLNLL